MRAARNWHSLARRRRGRRLGAFAGPSSETLHRTLCGRGETSKWARRSRGVGILGRIEGIDARGFRSGSARDRAPVVRAIEPFARLGELRRQFALQAVNLAGKFGDLGAGVSLHRIETRLEAFEGRGLLCVRALGVRRLDPGLEGADFVGHLVDHAEDLGALAARLWPVDRGRLWHPRGKGQLTPGKIGARHPRETNEAGRQGRAWTIAEKGSKRKGQRRAEAASVVSKDAEPRIESTARTLILRIGASGGAASLASATASSKDMGRLQEVSSQALRAFP